MKQDQVRNDKKADQARADNYASYAFIEGVIAGLTRNPLNRAKFETWWVLQGSHGQVRAVSLMLLNCNIKPPAIV